MTDPGFHLHGWLAMMKGSPEPVPPLCVEIFLSNGRSHYLQRVLHWEDDDPVALLRVWDLRAMTDLDLRELRERMNSVSARSDYNKAENIHPKLDWANLRVPKDQIAHCLEWHDRLWPLPEKIGFAD